MPFGVGLADLFSQELARGFVAPRLSIDELIAYAWSLTANQLGDPVGATALFAGVSVLYNRTELYPVVFNSWVAVFDDRLCPICRPWVGRIWEAGQEALMPPLHINCRCQLLSHHTAYRTRLVLDAAYYAYDALARLLGGWF